MKKVRQYDLSRKWYKRHSNAKCANGSVRQKMLIEKRMQLKASEIFRARRSRRWLSQRRPLSRSLFSRSTVQYRVIDKGGGKRSGSEGNSRI